MKAGGSRVTVLSGVVCGDSTAALRQVELLHFGHLVQEGDERQERFPPAVLGGHFERSDALAAQLGHVLDADVADEVVGAAEEHRFRRPAAKSATTAGATTAGATASGATAALREQDVVVEGGGRWEARRSFTSLLQHRSDVVAILRRKERRRRGARRRRS